MENTKPGSWSLQTLWNDLITEERVLTPREYIRGSEVGKTLLFRYLQMKGVPFTNHFDARILRVFDTGHIFEEDVMLRIFKLLGLVISTQDEVKVELPGLLPVIGHHDPRLGGKIDLENIKKTLKEQDVSEWMTNRVMRLAEKLATQYPNGLEDIITEMKTVNSQAFWAHKNADPETGFFRGYPHHKLQLWGYLKATGHPRGRLFYMSKDDLTLMETPILLDDPKLEELYIADIHAMTLMWEKGEKMRKLGQDKPIWDEKQNQYVIPDWLKEYIPESIVFNENKQKWELNWEIGRSNYLTLLTGCKTTDEWEIAMNEQLKDKNKGKCKGCSKEFTLTTLNKYDGYCNKCSKSK